MTDADSSPRASDTPDLRGSALAEFRELVERLAAGETVDLSSYFAGRPALASTLEATGPSTLNTLCGVLAALAETIPLAAGEVSPAEPDTPLEARIADIRAASRPRARYATRGEISRGGMGAIRRVWDELLRRELAMKLAIGRRGELLHFSTREDRSRVERFLREAEITGRLDHPGVVPVHEVGIDESGHVYFTMQLVRGQDLGRVLDMLRRGEEGWTRTRVLGVLLRACEAIAYAHSQGVIHRDLKPANIMVGEYGEAYVMDWGLARPRHSPEGSPPAESSGADEPDTTVLTREGAILGTPCYMAPEQAAGRVSELGPTVDVYAMGAILYELSAGRAPYSVDEPGITGGEIIAKIRQGPPAPLARSSPESPPELVAICEKAMAREVADRYPTMREFAEDLRAFLEVRVVRAYRTGPIAELWKWVLRNRTVAASMSLALLALVGGALWVAEAERSKRREVTLAGDSGLHAVLLAEFAELWPAGPGTAPRIRDWIDRAEGLLERAGAHRRRLERIEGDAETRAHDPFARERERSLVTGLEALADQDRGPLGKMRERHRLASGLARSTLDGPEAVAAWAEAQAAIRAHPLFGGYEVPPQLGLLPLGPDPDSGLWEFWHVTSGARPARDAMHRDWKVQPETGIVLVLIPGGDVTLGALGFPATLGGLDLTVEAVADSSLAEALGLAVGDRIVAIDGAEVARTDELDRALTRLGRGDTLRLTVLRGSEALELSAPIEERFDAFAESDEAPLHTVSLDPFFIAKYELTRAQWLRLAESRSADLREDAKPTIQERMAYPHPQTEVDWPSAHDLLRDHDLELPTEAQWEHAARGGTETIGWHGNDYSEGVLLERYRYVASPPPPGTVPVFSHPANPYGLHGVLGNAWEWCRDWYGPYELGVEPGSGERVVRTRDRSVRCMRGGSWLSSHAHIRSADRNQASPAWINYSVGIRPARAVRDTDGSSK